MKRKVNILLVEDDEVDVMNVKRAFRKHNIANELFVASDGIEALHMLRDTDHPMVPLPSIILLDLNMPRMNGIEFLKQIRNDERLKYVSVFILTTSNEERDKVDAYGYNVAGYIVKPVEFGVFNDAIAKLNMYWELVEFPTIQGAKGACV